MLFHRNTKPKIDYFIENTKPKIDSSSVPTICGISMQQSEGYAAKTRNILFKIDLINTCSAAF
jgi:hypothetical protein